ncbi:hypothetical protein VTK73DRAFT_4551 [Phialemonium thermophilum]|uniref:Secreted protein n=1 Tax=Phialemonium thermophilum TaxID=223376 RepID=A0ABR3V7P4_9PEZI
MGLGRWTTDPDRAGTSFACVCVCVCVLAAVLPWAPSMMFCTAVGSSYTMVLTNMTVCCWAASLASLSPWALGWPGSPMVGRRWRPFLGGSAVAAAAVVVGDGGSFLEGLIVGRRTPLSWASCFAREGTAGKASRAGRMADSGEAALALASCCSRVSCGAGGEAAGPREASGSCSW